MMRLDINLATQPYEDGRRFWMRWGPILGVAGIVTLGLMITALSSWAAARKDQVQMASFRTQIAKCEQDRANAQEVLDRPDNRGTRDQSQFINGLIRRKSFSWTQVFADLEKMMPPELHVTAIHPEVAKDNQLQIKLSVAGKSRDRALQLVHRMEQSPRFYQPQVVEESTQAQTGGDTAHFEIASAYIPEVETSPTGHQASTPGGDTLKSNPLQKDGAKSGTSKQNDSKSASPKPGIPKPAAAKSPVMADRKPH